MTLGWVVAIISGIAALIGSWFAGRNAERLRGEDRRKKADEAVKAATEKIKHAAEKKKAEIKAETEARLTRGATEDEIAALLARTDEPWPPE